MQTTLEQTEQKILIHTNENEVIRITQDLESRVSLLNQILSLGITNEKFRKVSVSLSEIDSYIHNRQLSENPELSKLHKAGIIVEAKLPVELENLSYALKAWLNLSTRRGGDTRFQHLVYSDGKYSIDEKSLEDYFEKSNIKVFCEAEMLKEYQEAIQLCEYLMKYEMQVQEIKNSQFLNKRIEPFGRNLLRPRWSFFVADNRGRN